MGVLGRAPGGGSTMTEQERKLLALADDIQADVAARSERAERREAENAADRAIESALSAELQACEQAGLMPLPGSDAEACTPVLYSRQPVVLVNMSAHPSSLVATALARAQRAQAFARVFEQSPIVDGDAEAAAFTLARMIEEVVAVLNVAVEHRGIIGASSSTMLAS